MTTLNGTVIIENLFEMQILFFPKSFLFILIKYLLIEHFYILSSY